ncbi:MAG: hypothetical protein GYB68_14305, partial [Chloroflexi bacterium]|nr:hypothetical protein [Chloroflexota bacterium]
MRRPIRSFIIFLLALFLVTLPATAQTENKVVGTGTPESCTEQALRDAIDGGGSISFDCGGGDVTITLTEELFFQDYDTLIDGGNRITLQPAGPGIRVVYFRTWGFDAARTLVLRNLSITGASRSGPGEESNGAAIYARSQAANFEVDIPTLILQNVTMTNNVSTQTSSSGNGYDFGGGAVYILGGQLTVQNSTFINNRSDGGAGGALHGLGSSILIENSSFQDNAATKMSGDTGNSGYGGSLYVDGTLRQGERSIQIVGSTFTGNTGENSGGVAYVNLYSDRGSFFSVDSSTFLNNTVSNGQTGWGGALAGGG